jgi:hypothetical protein
MISELITLTIILALLFFVYRFILVKVLNPDNDADDSDESDDDSVEESFEENRNPATVVGITGQKGANLPDDRSISPSGPNAPSAAPPRGEIVAVAPEQAFDPYAESNQTAYMTDNTRNPQRMFRPAPEQNNSSTAVESGIASSGSQYNPEMITNGAPFMDGVFALDSSETAGGSDMGFAPF